MSFLSRICCCLILVSCFACASTDTPADNASETTSAESTEFDEFGATFEAKEVLSYDELLNKMNANDSLQATVQGKVEAVCQAKGCWMNISSPSAGEEMVVKFKDYGFFVPKDISGREVVLQGKAFREVTQVDELRHLAEDAGKSAEEIAAITEPVVELKFMADGVRLLSE